MKREERKKRPVVIPYSVFSEELKSIFGGFGVPTYFKPSNTLWQLLVHPKDPVGKDKVVGPVYKISCEECEATYVGETERSLKARFVEHIGDQVPPRQRSRSINTQITPTTTSRWRILRFYWLNINGLKGEWRRLFTSEPWILNWTEMVDVTTCPWSGITKRR